MTTTMMIRIQSRDGAERIPIAPTQNPTVAQLKTQIESRLGVPIPAQTLSADRNLLLAKSGDDVARFKDMSDPNTGLSTLGIRHGSVVYLHYQGERTVLCVGPKVTPAGSFGRKMTMDDLIAKQMRVTRQEDPHCELVSFDRDAANAFQHYVNETLAFAVKRCGFMYGTISPEGKVEVDLIYEPPQRGTEDALILLRDPEEEKVVDAIAMNLGMRKVGFIFTQTIGQNKKDYTLSNSEVLQAVEMQAERDLKEWVTAVVKLEVNEDGGADVHFEAFQMSDMCVRLFKEGWFETEKRENEEIDPKLSRMKKDVIVGGKDMKKVDNDFFLVVVKIADHQGPLTTTFPVENRNVPVTMRALKNHLERSRGLSFVKRISDFHLLLLVSKFLDLNADVPALVGCVHTQSAIPEGYQLLIESLAASS